MITNSPSFTAVNLTPFTSITVCILVIFWMSMDIFTHQLIATGHVTFSCHVLFLCMPMVKV